MYKYKFIITISFIIFIMPIACAKHVKQEKYYQNIWCKEHQGITEYILPDKTRVDCLLKNQAVEFDFASKWAESIGQALYYSKMTNKKPAIVLIMESQGDEKYYSRANVLAKEYNIDLYKMKSEDYENYHSSDNIICEIISYLKNCLKLFLINLIDSL